MNRQGLTRAPEYKHLQSLTEKQVLYLLAQFGLLVFTGRLLANIIRRLGQATVIGELLAGLVLGLIGARAFFPAAYHLIFPVIESVRICSRDAWMA